MASSMTRPAARSAREITCAPRIARFATRASAGQCLRRPMRTLLIDTSLVRRSRRRSSRGAAVLDAIGGTVVGVPAAAAAR